MTIRIISILMIVIGAIFLILSFPLAMDIRKSVSGRLHRKWLIILYLMGFFIASYILFDIILIGNLPFPVELVTGVVFFGGAFFVYIIINISKNTIAARQKAEEESALAKEDWEKTFDAVTDMITIHDKDFNIIHANPSAKSMFGLHLEEGMPFVKCFRCYHGTENPPSGCASCQSLQTGKPSMVEMFEPYLNKHLEIRAMPRFEKDHQLVGLIHVVRDITDRKKVEETLRESEEKYRDLVKYAPAGIYEVDYETSLFISVNDVICEYTGYTRDELLTMNLFTLLTEESQKLMLARLEKLMAGEKIPQTVEYSIRTKGGEELWALLNTRYIYEAGTLKGATGVIYNITERRQAEIAQQEGQRQLKAILDNIPDIAWLKDKESRFIAVNKPFGESCGFEPEDVVGKTDLDIWPRDLAERYRADDKEVMESGKRKHVQEPLTDSEGKSLWIETTKTPIYDTQGNFIGTAGIARDITESKRAEDELKKRENLLQKIFDVLPVGLWIADKDGKLLRGNPAGVKIWGAEPKIGPSEYDVFKARRLPSGEEIAPEDWALAHTVREGVTVVDEMLEIDAFDGKKKVILNSTAPVLDDQGAIQGAIVVNLDITSLKEAEEELQHTLDSLRKAFGAIVQVMVSAVESRDPYTSGHQIRSADLARAIATEMELPPDIIEGLRMAGSIHDIGKLSIPAEILSKPTKLTNLEFSLIKEHANKGFEMLKDVESPWPLAEIVHQHHERMDGSGYPKKLKGEEILMEARILAVADVVEAMASHRPYRPGLGIDAALNEIEKNKGIFYDEAVVDACLRLFREKGFKLENT